MNIIVNTDAHMAGNQAVIRLVEETLQRKLARFAERLTRVEVQLTDQNSSGKSGPDDKKCVIEARLAGFQPITVSDEQDSWEHALNEAANKMKTNLERTIDKRQEHS